MQRSNVRDEDDLVTRTHVLLSEETEREGDLKLGADKERGWNGGENMRERWRVEVNL